MNRPQVLSMNESIVDTTKNIAVAAALLVTKNTDGLVSPTTNSGPSLDHNVELITNVVEYELIRRHGEA